MVIVITLIAAHCSQSQTHRHEIDCVSVTVEMTDCNAIVPEGAECSNNCMTQNCGWCGNPVSLSGSCGFSCIAGEQMLQTCPTTTTTTTTTATTTVATTAPTQTTTTTGSTAATTANTGSGSAGTTGSGATDGLATTTLSNSSPKTTATTTLANNRGDAVKTDDGVQTSGSDNVKRDDDGLSLGLIVGAGVGGVLVLVVCCVVVACITRKSSSSDNATEMVAAPTTSHYQSPRQDSQDTYSALDLSSQYKAAPSLNDDKGGGLYQSLSTSTAGHQEPVVGAYVQMDMNENERASQYVDLSLQ